MQKEINYKNINIEQAKKLQNGLRKQIQIQDFNKEIKIVGGADISFNRFSTTAYASIILLDFPSLKPIYQSLAKAELTFPYIPGYLAFREIPILLEAWKQMQIKPDILIIDGHGLSHPREMGIATHFGIVTNHATIGCAKKKLCGAFIEPQRNKGCYEVLKNDNKVIGAALCSKNNVKPIFISPGNKINLKSSIEIINKCTTTYKLPEPTRLAHKIVNLFRKGLLQEGFSKIE